MANAIIEKHQISLNGTRFRIDGPIRQNLISAFPSKLITGDYDYANQQLMSAWIINDQRGGIGIEEMDESVHADRAWFSELPLGYRRNLPLPRLATEIAYSAIPTFNDAGMEIWTTTTDLTFWTESLSGDGSVDRESVEVDSGTYSAKLTAGTGDPAGTTSIYQDANNWNNSLRGSSVTITMKCKIDEANSARLSISDGVGTTDGAYHTGGGGWETLTVTRTIDAGADKVRFSAEVTQRNGPEIGYYDTATFSTNTSGMLKTNFNGELYMAMGMYLLKLNSSRDGLDYVSQFASAITALIAGPNDMLYIYLGDSDNYQYMNTSEAITDTDVSAANLGIEWDSKLFKLDTDGNWWSATTPNAASPTWTAKGGITNIKSGDVKTLFIGRDADGNDIIYAATTSVLKAWDQANDIWTDTAVVLPDHPNGGEGATSWWDAIYISSGLDIRKYVVGASASIVQAGLSKEDGIPEEYNGEIVELVNGENYLYALVDASATSGNSKSGIFAYDDVGWEHVWAPPTTLIEDCEDAWNELVDGDVTATLDTDDFQVGSGSCKLVVATGAGAGDILATEAMSAIDLSDHNSVSLRIKSTVALDSGDLQLLLDNTAQCASPLEAIDIPAVSADTWTKVVLTLAAASSDTAIVSVGLKMVVDKGAFTVNLDQIEGQTYNGSMKSAIVSSSSSAYALYFGHDSKIYKIDLYRGIRNPHKLPGTFTYGTDGIHMTPWFDAGTAVESKTAKRVHLFCKGMSANESVIARYRIDHDETDRDTGWTTLGTITSNGKTTFTFGTNEVGVAFQDLQFRFDLARGGTTTNSPKITAVVLEYLKITKRLWNWNMTIDCMESFDDLTPQEIWAALKVAAESTTLLEFTFRGETDGSETHYVFVHPFNGITQTGENHEGKYNLSLVEP